MFESEHTCKPGDVKLHYYKPAQEKPKTKDTVPKPITVEKPLVIVN